MDGFCVARVWSLLRKPVQGRSPTCVTLANGCHYRVLDGRLPSVGDDSRLLALRPIDDNAFLQEIYRERLVAAEVAADRVREIQKTILAKWARMGSAGVLYQSGERKADSDALEEAEGQFRMILASVYEVEDDLCS